MLSPRPLLVRWLVRFAVSLLLAIVLRTTGMIVTTSGPLNLTPFVSADVSVRPASVPNSLVPVPPVYRQWGVEALDQIDRTFFLPSHRLYAEQVESRQPREGRPSFFWSGTVQLSALAAAAQVEPATYVEPMNSYAIALRTYWTKFKGIFGFDVLPGPKDADRYYDDNEWMVLALIDAYQATHDPFYINWAQETFRFVQTGEDLSQGGGIYWRENDHTTKNTCSNAPAVVGALRLYQLTGEKDYLTTAQRLYSWTNSKFQDSDGLYFDNLTLDGKIDRTKWSYNSAMMIQADTLLFQVTSEPRYMLEAERVARSAEKKWILTDSGAIADVAPFAQLLTEGFLSVHNQDGDAHWMEIVNKALGFLRRQVLVDGTFGSRWDGFYPERKASVRLIDSASAARAFWVRAGYTN